MFLYHEFELVPPLCRSVHDKRIIIVLLWCRRGPVIEYLSTQGRPDPSEGLHCFWCPNKTWNLPLDASETQTIVENRLKMRKLQAPPKSKGSRTFFKNKSLNTTNAGSQTLQKILMLLCCYYSSKMVCRTSGGVSIAL